MAKRIDIDGSGGGQVLRSAITLSLLTELPFRITEFRERGSKPGLRGQHIAAVEAAREIAPESRIRGAKLGNSVMTFEPGEVHAGLFKLEVPRSGSVSTVLQTIALPLAMAGGRSLIHINGGTHVAGAPTFEFLSCVWRPTMDELGLEVVLTLERAGFCPRGRGEVTASISPLIHPLRPLIRAERPNVERIQMSSIQTSNLHRGIDRRQCDGFLAAFRPHRSLVGELLDIERNEGRFEFTSSTGTTFLAVVGLDCGPVGFQQLGARDRRAEIVGGAAAEEMVAFLESGAAVDRHLADQLLLPLALADGDSTFTASEVTRHMQRQADVIAQFLGVEIRFVGEAPVKVEIRR